MGLSSAQGLGAAAMSTTQVWTALTFALMLLMWWIMMLGMMIPSAAPMILLFGRMQRQQLADDSPYVRTAQFAGGYLLVWAMFSAVATAAQWALSRTELWAGMSMRVATSVAATILLVGGLYQLTPLKRVCLKHCRSPVEFLALRWRKGAAGAWRMGVEHGAFCVGCCWLLMALLFVGGVMNLAWVAALAVLVLAEKLSPRGELLAAVAGFSMLGFSLALFTVA